MNKGEVEGKRSDWKKIQQTDRLILKRVNSLTWAFSDLDNQELVYNQLGG